jgi:hypothetical protein
MYFWMLFREDILLSLFGLGHLHTHAYASILCRLLDPHKIMFRHTGVFCEIFPSQRASLTTPKSIKYLVFLGANFLSSKILSLRPGYPAKGFACIVMVSILIFSFGLYFLSTSIVSILFSVAKPSSPIICPKTVFLPSRCGALSKQMKN